MVSLLPLQAAAGVPGGPVSWGVGVPPADLDAMWTGARRRLGESDPKRVVRVNRRVRAGDMITGADVIPE